MTIADMAWAYEQQLPPLDKFVLVTWADCNFDPDVCIQSLAARTSIPAERVEKIVERLIVTKRMPDGWTNERPVSNYTAVNRRVVYPLLVKRDGEQCRGCGDTSNLQIDHVMPRALGGTNDLANLQLLCGPCNRRKRDRHPDAWHELLAREGIGELVSG